MTVHGLVLLRSAASEASHPEDGEHEPDDPYGDPYPRDEEEEQDPKQHERNGYPNHVPRLPGLTARKQLSLKRSRGGRRSIDEKNESPFVGLLPVEAALAPGCAPH